MGQMTRLDPDPHAIRPCRKVNFGSLREPQPIVALKFHTVIFK